MQERARGEAVGGDDLLYIRGGDLLFVAPLALRSVLRQQGIGSAAACTARLRIPCSLRSLQDKRSSRALTLVSGVTQRT